MNVDYTAALQRRGEGKFPGYVGIEVVEVVRGRVRMRLVLRPEHLAPNGYLHAGVVVTLADTAAGYGTLASLPEGAQNFTTIELKSNHFSTLREGALACTSTQLHGGRTTHVWDSIVTDEATGKTLAAFRCTQLIMYPREGSN
ncbi:MAG: PaaI family thioesterase [Candidatus Velthaea sp.]